MSRAPSTMLLRCSARCHRTGLAATPKGYRSVSSAPFVGSDVVVPPDSPRFIFVPQPPQRSPVVNVQRKGTLPKPRKPLRRTADQLPWHLENTAPEPVTTEQDKNIPSQHKEHVDWKSSERNLRRQNFLEGYSALRLREAGYSGKKKRPDAHTRIKPQVAPEPSYEEMSRPSVLSFMTKSDTWKHASRSKEDLEARRLKYEERQQAKEYEKRTNFHTLYINAKNFIVNSEQLEDRLNKVFDSEFYQYNKDKHFGIWDEQGWPEDTNYLMYRTSATAGVAHSSISAANQDAGYTETARRRIMKVTEEMTGGKLVPDVESSTR